MKFFKELILKKTFDKTFFSFSFQKNEMNCPHIISFCADTFFTCLCFFFYSITTHKHFQTTKIEKKMVFCSAKNVTTLKSRIRVFLQYQFFCGWITQKLFYFTFFYGQPMEHFLEKIILMRKNALKFWQF